MIYTYFGKFYGLPGVFVIKRLIYVEFWKGKEKEKKKKGNMKYRRPEWDTAHFEAPVTIGSLDPASRQGFLCHDMVAQRHSSALATGVQRS